MMAASEDYSSTSDGSSSDDNVIVIERKYVEQAIAMINTPSEEQVNVRHMKAIKQCNLPGLRALGLCSTKERSTSSLLNQVRTCIGKHDFKQATKCLKLLLDKSSRVLPVIWKTCFVILLNHPNSNMGIVEDFLQTCLGLRNKSQMGTFLEEILTLPNDLEPISKGFRKIRK